MTISELAVQIAISRIGIREHGGNNRGPEIDAYARAVGLDPAGAYPWCTSGMYDVFEQAGEQMRISSPFPRTAKAVKVWELLQGVCVEPNPARGYLYVLDHGKPWDILTEWKTRHYTDNGHLGIVTDVDSRGTVSEVSGNTNDAGSREGNCWAMHTGSPEVTHGGVLLGYLNLEKLIGDGNAQG